MQLIRYASVLFLAAALGAQTITVGPPGSGLPTINQGIAMCPTGGIVLALNGNYPYQVNLQGRAITVRSQTPLGATIDVTSVQPGPGNVPIPAVLAVSGEQRTTVLEGFVITGGASPQGGGICCIGSSPTIVDNRIVANGRWNNVVWGPGGGIYTTNGSPLIDGNTIIDNFGTSGGGIYASNSSVTLNANALTTNNAQLQGGGVHCQGGRQQITDNTFTDNFSGFRGGAIDLDSIVNATFTGNTLVDNRATSGGGLSSFNTGTAVVTITGNTFEDNFAHGNGGGIHCDQSSPTIGTNTFTSNVAEIHGGGIHVVASANVSVVSNTLTGNGAFLGGGGIAVREGSTATLESNTLASNVCTRYGAGVYVADASVSLRGNVHTLNGLQATFQTPNGTSVLGPVEFGGGLAARQVTGSFPTNVTVSASTLHDNFAVFAGGGVWLTQCTGAVRDSDLRRNGTDNATPPSFTNEGGGLFADHGTYTVERNQFVRNEADLHGAGVALAFTSSGSVFVNNIVAKNFLHDGPGAGVWLNSVAVTFVNNTIAQNVGNDQLAPSAVVGTALYVAGGAGPAVTNCILRGPNGSTVVDAITSASAPLVAYGNLGNNQGGNWIPGAGVINVLPGFVNPNADDFHILPTSACRDMGLNTAPGLPVNDIDGQARIQGPAVDLGADEVG